MAQKVHLGNGPAIPSKFYQIKDIQFCRLEKLCHIALGDEARTALRQVHLIHLLEVYIESQSPYAHQVEKSLSELKEALANVSVKVSRIDYTLGSLLSFHGVSSEDLETFKRLADAIASACVRVVDTGDLSQRTFGSVSGRPKHPHFEQYVAQLGAIFQSAGGKVRAGRPWGPFVRFVWEMSTQLPRDLPQPLTLTAVGEAMRRALQSRKGYAKSR